MPAVLAGYCADEKTVSGQLAQGLLDDVFQRLSPEKVAHLNPRLFVSFFTDCIAEHLIEPSIHDVDMIFECYGARAAALLKQADYKGFEHVAKGFRRAAKTLTQENPQLVRASVRNLQPATDSAIVHLWHKQVVILSDRGGARLQPVAPEAIKALQKPVRVRRQKLSLSDGALPAS